jgi:hypothetical protein
MRISRLFGLLSLFGGLGTPFAESSAEDLASLGSPITFTHEPGSEK